MKICTFFVVGFWLVSASAFGDLSVADWEKLSRMLKESEARTRDYIKESGERMRDYIKESGERMQKTVAREETRMQQTVAGLETRVKEHVSHENAKVIIKIDEMNKRIDIALLFLLALLAFIGVLIGLPMFRERKAEQERDEKMAAQQRQIAALQEQLETVLKELATLKQKEIPSDRRT